MGWYELLRRQPATSPAPRRNAGMAYDPDRRRIVLFGGDAGVPSSEFGDTWEWDGVDWTRLAPAGSPSPRTAHAMYYDPQRREVMLYGGSQSGASARGWWGFDGQAWRAATTSATGAAGSPPVRDMAMVFDAARGEALTFGGVGSAQDTWRLGPSMQARVTPTLGTGCVGTAGVPQIATFGPPALGNLGFAGEVTEGRPHAPGVLLLGTAAVRLALGGGPCVLFTDPASAAVVPFSTNAFGFATRALPLSPVLGEGLSVRMQAAVLDPLAAGLGVATTSAIRLQTGR